MATSAVPPARRVAGAAFSVGLAALLLTACGAGGLTSSGSSDSFAGGGSEGGPAAAGERAVGADDGGGDVEQEDAPSSVGADVEVGERDLVHTADLTVRVDDVSEASELAKELTIGAGGYVASESLSTPAGGTPEGNLTLRVPNDGYEGALEALGELGDRSNLERSVEDVTEEVADVESRIASSEASLETLRGYLEEARDVDDLLRVESEIQTRQSELEAFQARLETLTNQTSYSTVHLRLTPPETYLEEPSEEGIGFLGGLERGWRALVALGGGVAVAVGWLLPFLVAAAVLGAGPVWWYRSRRRGAAPGRKASDRPRGTEAARSGAAAPRKPGGDAPERAAGGGSAAAAASPAPSGTADGEDPGKGTGAKDGSGG
ncbi:DUF4349 domain-containing protein [Nocardiopsis tropica]|uniref:DUF4349 domain-containing protein n=2 Tax=Nocardiopsis tropica TaxID=109330 RepID=A0ABU7KZ85_9ACTN|nr:DUF4349 domain-containing protein [Nocardiopsis umidischolae]MEE2053967.1 DUF4349 domain-containing protein [Nocardiopsis umidischolae]